MLKFLLIIVTLFAAMLFFSSEAWDVTIQVLGYEVHFSFAVALFFLVLFWFIWKILKKPFTWIKSFHGWRKNKLQQSKDAFVSQLLNTLANADCEEYPSLLSSAKKLYGAQSQNYLLLQSILRPDPNLFTQMTKDPSTFLTGTRGLVDEAMNQGDIAQAAQLLGTLNAKQQTLPWVLQTKWEIALIQNDWQTALKLLDVRRKLYDKETYLSYRACLLMKLGQIQEAYRLNPNNSGIAVAYARAFPKKAIKTLIAAWNRQPTWDIYLAYAQATASLPAVKRMKAILKLIKKNPRSRWALLACADMAIQTQQWQRAKENIEVYLQSYPLTKQVAGMMARIERDGYHHEENARDWDQKAVEAEDITGWVCSSCNHHLTEWQPICPHCNTLDVIHPLG